ncbi:isopenicillin N synthase family oxygenase [Leptolyngbya sp. FACHB-17]|uniref:isopenicillin N synthase family dioxygenase n=1 Tax=unclassified Leptolyngbya TaxID=2650499 RepID=UPI0016819652|nr:isopenicillin N synthase family oxygenase [Leptolyngbya sp. FACHB-17]MBD2080811.1 isopenicillin N synthase family oxygenase [Leptolyngbya sp. FACHB-17]
MKQPIPIADLQSFLSDDPTQQQNFVLTIGNALEDIGFFALINHGVDRTLIQRAYQLAEAFFELPADVKLRYEDPSLNGQRGFTRLGKEHAKDYPVPDLKEFWHVGRENHLLNLDPIEVPEFRSIMNQLYAQLEHCAVKLLEACALYLGEQRSFLSDTTINADTILRIIHYPPIPEDVDPASLRSAPHEDINLITLLCEATESGLELLQRDGTWRAIPNVEGQIIVDSGDMLQQLTNGLLKSTTHRVVNPGDRSRRFSMPFFVHPTSKTDLTPLQGCIDCTGGTIKFPKITAGKYLQQRLAEIGLK